MNLPPGIFPNIHLSKTIFAGIFAQNAAFARSPASFSSMPFSIKRSYTPPDSTPDSIIADVPVPSIAPTLGANFNTCAPLATPKPGIKNVAADPKPLATSVAKLGFSTSKASNTGVVTFLIASPAEDVIFANNSLPNISPSSPNDLNIDPKLSTVPTAPLTNDFSKSNDGCFGLKSFGFSTPSFFNKEKFLSSSIKGNES